MSCPMTVTADIRTIREVDSPLNRACHPLLKPLIPVVRVLGGTLGRDYEIILHDVSGEEPFIVAMENAELTDRDMDAPLTEFGHYLLEDTETHDLECLMNYRSEAPDGRVLRSSVALIRDEAGKLVGFLCINYDTTKGFLLKDLGEFLTRFQPAPGPGTEKFGPREVDQPREILEEARQVFGKPLRYAGREERRQIVKWLDEKGYFRLKHAMPRLTSETGMSRYTLYADLRAVRSQEEESPDRTH